MNKNLTTIINNINEVQNQINSMKENIETCKDTINVYEIASMYLAVYRRHLTEKTPLKLNYVYSTVANYILSNCLDTNIDIPVLSQSLNSILELNNYELTLNLSEILNIATQVVTKYVLEKTEVYTVKALDHNEKPLNTISAIKHFNPYL